MRNLKSIRDFIYLSKFVSGVFFQTKSHAKTFNMCRRNFASSAPSKYSRAGKRVGYLIGGIAGASALGAIYLNHSKINADSEEQVPTNIIPSRKVHFPSGLNSGDMKLTLFQYQTCPFCCKVRAFLDYYGISYNVVEVNPVMRQQIKFSNTKKVPILVVEDPDGIHQVKDSSVIISALYSFFLDKKQDLTDVIESFPLLSFVDVNGNETKDIFNRYFIMFRDSMVTRDREELRREREWREWADTVLVHTLSPNVYREPKEALQAFRWFSDVGEWETHFAAWERLFVIYVGAAAMYMVGKRLKKRHGLKEDVRESLYDACKTWLREIGKARPFHGGDKPNLADLAVYGVLNAIEGCDSFKDAQQHTGIGIWYNKMKQEVSEHSGTIV